MQWDNISFVDIDNYTIEDMIELLNKYPYNSFYLQQIEEKLGNIDISQESDFEIGFLYNNMGNSYDHIKEYKKSLKYYQKSLDIALKIFDKNHINIAMSYNNIGNAYNRIEEYKKALEYYNKSLNIRLKLPDKDKLEIANSYNNIATVYNSIGEYKKALEYLNKSLEINLKEKSNKAIAMNYNNMGNVYNSMKNYKKALEYYKKSLDINLKIFDKNHPKIKMNYNNIQSVRNKLFFIDNPKLTTIKIKNFKLLKDLEISLNSNINIIIGENSSGKTSLLQAITFGLLARNHLIGERGSRPYLKYITKSQNKATIETVFNEYEKITIISDIQRRVDNDLYPFVLAYGSNILTNYDNKLSDVVKNLIDRNINDGFVTSIFQDYDSGFYNPKSIINELYRINTDRSKELIEIIIDTIEYFQDDFKLVLEDNVYVFQDKNNTIFKLEDLSEGYRSNILLITDIVIKILGVGESLKDVRGVILIDEFDKHLHPKWQSNLVGKLQDKFPNIQFILTTHNPMSILDREPDEVTIIKNIDGELRAIKKDIGTKKIGVSTVLLEYFGVKSTIGATMESKLNQFTKLKLKSNLTQDEQKEFKELEEFLDNSIATNFIYNRAYFNFLKFLKDNKNIDFEEFQDISDEEMAELFDEFKDLFE